MAPDLAAILLFLYCSIGALIVAVLGLILQVRSLRQRVLLVEQAFDDARIESLTYHRRRP